MEIIINGRQAWLKKNTSFEYIAENPLFTGSDSYSLTITFPLKDCPDNIAIFGHLHRHDVEKKKVIFDCEIRDKQFYKSGCITVTQISDVEVKTQFLEGRSEQNFNDTFDNIYLNQLSLGYPSNVSAANNDITEMWENSYPEVDHVALPWVNNTSGNLQNCVKKDADGDFQWDTATLSFQPFLVPLLEKICKAIKYTGVFTSIKNSTWKYLLVCNALPDAWSQHDYAAALPHWSLTEFFEQLEYFLKGEFTINHKAKTIRFDFSSEKAKKTTSVYINKVVNKYSVDVTQENKCDYIATKNLSYADNDNRLWAFRCCQWYIDKHKDGAIVYNTLNELLQHAATLKESGVYITSNGRGTTKRYYRGYPNASDGNRLFYAKDVDTYFIMYCYKSELYETTYVKLTNTNYNWYKYYNKLIPVNQFGKYLFDKNADEVELNIVPAWIDDTEDDLGPSIFLECGEMGSAVTYTDENDSGGTVSGNSGNHMGGTRGVTSFSGERGRNNDNDETDYNDGALAQGTTGKAILKGDQEKNDAYFDKIYVAFWDGYIRKSGKLPHPMVDKVEVYDDFTSSKCSYSLRLEAPKGTYKYTYDIDNKKKYTFSFLSDEIPDPRAVYYIEGSRYICEKITATFQESTGKSQLLKGNFYRII